MTPEDYEHIIKSQFTAKQVQLIFKALDFEVGSPFAWLNYWKNSAPVFKLGGVKPKNKRPARYTFVDACLVIWVRSVSSGNVKNSQNKPGGMSLRKRDIIKVAPEVKRKIKEIVKDDAVLVEVDFIPSDICQWNKVVFNLSYLIEDVADAVLRLKDKGDYLRGAEW